MELRSLGSSSQHPTQRSTTSSQIATSQTTISQETRSVTPDLVTAVRSVEPIPNINEIESAIKTINKTLSTLSASLEFSIDEESNRTIIKVVDIETKEIIRQMPSEEALDIAKALDKMQGLLIRQKA